MYNILYNSRCRPTSAPFWYGLFLIGGLLFLLTLVLLVFLLFRFKKENAPSQKYKSHWHYDYIGLGVVSVCLFVAWGVGLPATRPFNVGYLRLFFQLIFLVGCALCGLLMVIFFCLLSKQVMAALCCRRRNRSKSGVANDIYIVNQYHAKEPPANADSNGGDTYAMKEKGMGVSLHFDEDDTTTYNLSFENIYDEVPKAGSQTEPAVNEDEERRHDSSQL